MSDLSNIRVGRVTSSDCVAVLSMGTRPMDEDELAAHKKEFPKSQKKNCECWPGAAAQTYIDECRMERQLLRPLENKVEVLAMSWGKLCEKIVHGKLGMAYKFHSNDTLTHPTIQEWVGTPDGTKITNVLGEEKVDTVTDIKCPLTLKAFCNLVSGLYEPSGKGFGVKKIKNVDMMAAVQSFRDNAKDGEKFYWQLVSNACITKAKYAELIVFVPYFEELEKVQEFNKQLHEGEQFGRIGFAKDGELPYLYKKSGYSNINIIRFEVPLEDKKLLTLRVEQTIKEINK